MDLLGSILGNMEKPPSISSEQKKKEKQEREKFEKLQEEERKQKAKFRKSIEVRISKFVNDSEKTSYQFEAMEKVSRTIVHDVADIAGLITHAFGKEESGRYIMIFKKEFPPSEEEIAAYKRGEEWDPEKDTQKPLPSIPAKSDPPTTAAEPSTNYRDKYKHLIGTTSAKDAARKTEANKSFGMVPSRNKRDVRSIEQTMNEIREKKRQKTNEKDP